MLHDSSGKIIATNLLTWFLQMVTLRDFFSPIPQTVRFRNYIHVIYIVIIVHIYRPDSRAFKIYSQDSPLEVGWPFPFIATFCSCYSLKHHGYRLPFELVTFQGTFLHLRGCTQSFIWIQWPHLAGLGLWYLGRSCQVEEWPPSWTEGPTVQWLVTMWCESFQ